MHVLVLPLFMAGSAMAAPVSAGPLRFALPGSKVSRYSKQKDAVPPQLSTNSICASKRPEEQSNQRPHRLCQSWHCVQFLAGTFCPASRELSAHLPTLGLRGLLPRQLSAGRASGARRRPLQRSRRPSFFPPGAPPEGAYPRGWPFSAELWERSAAPANAEARLGEIWTVESSLKPPVSERPLMLMPLIFVNQREKSAVVDTLGGAVHDLIELCGKSLAHMLELHRALLFEKCDNVQLQDLFRAFLLMLGQGAVPRLLYDNGPCVSPQLPSIVLRIVPWGKLSEHNGPDRIVQPSSNTQPP